VLPRIHGSVKVYSHLLLASVLIFSNSFCSSVHLSHVVSS